MGTDTAKGFAAISARVTRSVFEKVDQNIVQPFFCQNELHSWKKVSQKFALLL
jgi:hypothetical protein